MRIFHVNSSYLDTYREIYMMAALSMTTHEFHPKRKKLKYYQKVKK